MKSNNKKSLEKNTIVTAESYPKTRSLIPAGIRVVQEDPTELNDLGGSGWLLVDAKAPIRVVAVSSLVPLDPPPGCKLTWEVTER